MNRHIPTFCFLVVLTLAVSATAQVPKHAARADTLIHEAIIDAPLGDVWNAFTQEELITQWMVPKAELDFRIGGTLRTNYKPEGVIGDEHTIEHTFLAYEHERMLAMKVTKCPANFPFQEESKQMWSVIYFDRLTPNRTHLRIAGIGYGTGDNWDRMRAFFEQGNEWTIQQLKKCLAKQTESNTHVAETHLDSALAPLVRFLGGQWEVHGTWSTGEPLHARTIYEIGVGGKFIRARTYALRSDGTEYQRYESILGWNADAASLTFTSYTYNGSVTEGTITPTDADTLSYEWTKGSPSASGTIGQTIEFLSNDEARWIAWLEAEEGKQQLLDATWKRTSIAPLELEAIMETLNQE